MNPASPKKIYLDYSATTPVDPLVVEAMLPYFTEQFGNPSSVHRYGREGRAVVEAARATLAEMLHVRESEIFFVSGGTEANNLAVCGVARQNHQRGKHLITSPLEHPSVYNTFRRLEKEGYEVTWLKVDRFGRVRSEDLEAAIRPDTVLVSLMYGNNEVGSLSPLDEIARITREAGVCLHCDAVQAFGKLPIDLSRFPIDLLSFSAHKIYGPKGIGGLFIRKGVPFRPLFSGGNQERGRRPGTENTPAIAGFAKAAQLCREQMEEEHERIGELRNFLQRLITEQIDNVLVNGHPTERLYHLLNVSFLGCDSEMLLLHLDMAGVAVSSGSACSSGAVEPSRVLREMGLGNKAARAGLRFSLGRFTTKEEIEQAFEILKDVVARVRGMG